MDSKKVPNWTPWTNITLAVVLILGTLSQLVPSPVTAEELTVYSGRAERFIKPVLDKFEKHSGITIQLLTSKTASLITRLDAEGKRTPADVLITNDAGGLERARELGLFSPILPKAIHTTSTKPGSHEASTRSLYQAIEQAIPAPYRAKDQSWIGLSGRFYLVVYNTNLVKPDEVNSILDLADPRWKGKIAIHNSGSEYLQAGVAIMTAFHGHDTMKQFLRGLKTNAGTHVYGKSSQIVKAVARGEVALGIVNHYYVYRYLDKKPEAPIAILIPDQDQAGMGALLNVAGTGIIKYTHHRKAAEQLIQFLVSTEGQKMFAELNKEYPLHPQVKAHSALPLRSSFRASNVPLWRLGELREPTMTLIEEVGLR